MAGRHGDIVYDVDLVKRLAKACEVDPHQMRAWIRQLAEGLKIDLPRYGQKIGPVDRSIDRSPEKDPRKAPITSAREKAQPKTESCSGDIDPRKAHRRPRSRS